MKTTKIYLSEELNIAKMFSDFKVQFPNIKCCYESYRSIFLNSYNISFGYPRKDTCSTCDKFEVDMAAAKLNVDVSAEQIRKMEDQKKLHLAKADTFYKRKKAARLESKADPTISAVCFDFQKNLPMPNISSQDVYYSRQLSFYSFNIHVLDNDKVYIYSYDETVGNKGADDVCSMLKHFIENFLPETTTHLKLFCDGCAGQNKNYTVLRFFYHLVHDAKRLTKVQITFPVRGHSYMECDRDMANVNQKTPCQIPSDWQTVVREARGKGGPFEVINFTRESFFGFTDYFRPRFLAQCPLPTRPVREIFVDVAKPGLLTHRANWNGPKLDTPIKPKKFFPYESIFGLGAGRGRGSAARGRGSVARGRGSARGRGTGREAPAPPAEQLPELKAIYRQPLPISTAKYNDLIKLTGFINHENRRFFENLPHDGDVNDEHEFEEIVESDDE